MMREKYNLAMGYIKAVRAFRVDQAVSFRRTSKFSRMRKYKNGI